jgi:hypothetical protein
MKLLKTKSLNRLILGSSLLATGGGGSLQSAKRLIKKLTKPIKLISLNELSPNDTVMTVFGIGGQEKCNPVIAAKAALNCFQTTFRQKVKAIIPVEIGPLAIAMPSFIAAEINLPLLDADIVGFRSSPEVFLETITIPGLSREPSVIANDQGDTLILYSSQNIQTTEKILRDFAVHSGGDAIVLGYPLKRKDIDQVVGRNSLSFSLKLGQQLQSLKNQSLSLKKFCRRNNFIILGQGKIIKQEKSINQGFTLGKYTIRSNSQNQKLDIFIKNENIALAKNGQIILTVPDLICLLDTDIFIGLNNFDKNIGKNIAILAKKSLPIWRTKKGLKLFSPKNLGFNLPQKILE